MGARNVIYGTTAANELEREEDGAWINPNLTATEQYRYMLTAIDDQNDWTHEREWRWTNQSTVYKSHGDHLPIWQNNVTANFNIEWGMMFSGKPHRSSCLRVMKMKLMSWNGSFQDLTIRIFIT
ncbi:hypothetical protein [Dawidia soli]|uniref:Uncharacterized protein n=1 Tax=Dawidia soli TaxID=2782352 RepID=A0AAP2GK44_9BACT|nr:hypothetical protein [Dawidia soli]MBT1688643.1 hypothetical protein [Dawidia soli]